MKKKSSIIKLSIIGVIIAIGLILSFSSFNVGYKTFNSFASSIKLGIDLEGGFYAVYEADTSVDDFENSMNSTRQGLESILAARGYTASVTKEGTDKFRVEVPRAQDPEEILKILGEPAEVRFVRSSTQETFLTGADIKSAVAGYVQGSPVCVLVFNDAGTKKFADATTEYKGETIEIITTIGGESESTSISITDPITNGQAYISSANIESAEKLANQVLSGTLSVSLSLKESSSISAVMGENALKWSLIAGAIGIILAIAILIFIYRLFGVITAINIITYGVLMLLFLAIFPWVELTLAGIAGLLLGMFLTFDGCIITFERIKSEYRNGKSITASTYYGFRKSMRPIIDIAVMTLLVAIVLWIFPTASLRSFATALLAGTIISSLITLFITRKLVKYFLAINDVSASLYGLQRGKDYIGLGADQTAGDVQREIDAELINKARVAQENDSNNAIDKGGLQGEIV